MEEGFNTFRVPFQQERLSPPETGIAGPFNEAYLSDLKKVSFDFTLVPSPLTLASVDR